VFDAFKDGTLLRPKRHDFDLPADRRVYFADGAI